MITERKIAVIMFTDIVGSSARMGEDEAETLGLLSRDFALMHEVVKRYCGEVLKHLGDGMLVNFGNAVDAVMCAVAIQKAMHRIEAKASRHKPLQHRIGIHLGVVYAGQHDILGDNVNIAARIQGEAEPGGICFSQPVYEMIRGKLRFDIESMGARSMKNIKEKMQLYGIRLPGAVAEPARAAMAEQSRPKEISGGPSTDGFMVAGILEASTIAAAILSRRAPFLELVFFAPARLNGFRFFEGIFESHYARMALFFSLYLVVLFLARKLAGWLRRIVPQQQAAGLVAFTSFNLILVMVLTAAISALRSLDPNTGLW